MVGSFTAHNNHTTLLSREEFSVNILLWVLQVLLGLAFIFAGYGHGFNIKQSRTRMVWMNAVSDNLLVFIGTCEILGGIGLILPAATRILPALTAWAATGLAVIMILAALFHLLRREYRNIIFNLVLFALAAFVAYGRFVLVSF
jgi:uncharacterized membrane protein YphA (DoxX/SURF4 family)